MLVRTPPVSPPSSTTWCEGSVSIDTDNNTTLFAGTWRAHKYMREERLCWVNSWTDADLSSCIWITSGCPCPWRERGILGVVEHDWSSNVWLYICCPTPLHSRTIYGYGTTLAPTACGCCCPSIQVDGWLWLVKSVALSPGLLMSGSNWHGSRQARLSHAVGHDWPEDEGAA